jgi:hypothetical protein
VYCATRLCRLCLAIPRFAPYSYKQRGILRLPLGFANSVSQPPDVCSCPCALKTLSLLDVLELGTYDEQRNLTSAP